jgi:hypothetical protein
MVGQASGGFLESSSALRLLHVGVRNTVGVLTDDAFTQTNPPIVATAGTISTNVDTDVLGVLSGSVAFTRPDAGSNFIGGNAEGLADPLAETFVRPLGLFINSANGNPFENTPGQASGKGPYVSAQGTYASQLFETQVLDGGGIAGTSTGTDLVYTTGAELIASRNGYLMPRATLNDAGAAVVSTDDAANAAEVEHGLAASTTIGILKMPADAVQPELVFDQRL